MCTGWVYDPEFLNHETSHGHPERAQRLLAIEAALRDSGLLPRMKSLEFKRVSRDVLQWLHWEGYVWRVEQACASGKSMLYTPDCSICHETYDVARLAVGAVIAACDAVMDQQVRNAFCSVRPPGHHAEYSQAMGFCYFNNVALAAEHLLRHHKLKRIAIVDFDVHHGNGTQHLFDHRRDVLFISLHQDPATLYPGTGYAEEHGQGAGEGFTVNLPMSPGAGDDQYKQVMRGTVCEKIAFYKPEFILISAGFDAEKRDFLSNMNVTPQGFAMMTEQLTELAEQLCAGRLVSVLEGGYNLEALAECAVAHVSTLMNAATPGE